MIHLYKYPVEISEKVTSQRPRHDAGLTNCRYVAHQSDTQGQIAPKGYIARQEMTPEIAHCIHVGRLQNEMVWMQSDLSPHRLHTVFFWCHFNQCRAPIKATFGQP